MRENLFSFPIMHVWKTKLNYRKFILMSNKLFDFLETNIINHMNYRCLYVLFFIIMKQKIEKYLDTGRMEFKFTFSRITTIEKEGHRNTDNCDVSFLSAKQIVLTIFQ